MVQFKPGLRIQPGCWCMETRLKSQPGLKLHHVIDPYKSDFIADTHIATTRLAQGSLISLSSWYSFVNIKLLNNKLIAAGRYQVVRTTWNKVVSLSSCYNLVNIKLLTSWLLRDDIMLLEQLGTKALAYQVAILALWISRCLQDYGCGTISCC